MGSYRSIYIGPYVRCKVEMVQREIDFRSCPKPRCPEYERERFGSGFCERCGGLIAIRKKIVAVPSVDDGEVLVAIEESLSTPSGNGYHESTIRTAGASTRLTKMIS